ncbi:TonB-dependent receptor [Olivibacter sitiensis]|uniref:TonB-dependent receptor n=1 Tax=Olivibacter sitiensis TaxID=376470 RepID=UPI0003F91A37|nr:TonB-dependent receptor [Olivibacter sitiensis]
MKHFQLASLFSFLFLSVLFAQAQSHQITGTIQDSAYVKKLVQTSVSILNQKDSTLVSYTRADDKGSFVFQDVPNGRYILLVTYPKYADFVDFFVLDSAETNKEYGDIYMTLKATLLAEVLVQGSQAITIKGDTTEYDAASFVIQPNAKVEDLLKQLPGIQVDRDGKITAQGQTVEKVLVDGEEFFGDDPTLVTKNLRGDMVDKVQLYDKKSDQATFTGIDDGETTKTINIKLKEDQKRGYFGKVDVGGGTDDFYDAQAMFNMFRGKRKFAAYGTLSNTGKTGLGWQDNERFVGLGNMTFGDDGTIYITGGGDDFESFSGRYDGRGIPKAANGGLHYDEKWNEDKQSINANFKAGVIDVTGEESNISQNNLPSGSINSVSSQRFDKHSARQKIDGIYEIRLDSTSTVKVMLDATNSEGSTNNDSYQSTTDGQERLLNNSSTVLNNNTKTKQFNASGLWTKKLKKMGRTLSVSLAQSLSKNDANGFLNSQNNFYDVANGEVDSTILVNQRKVNDIKSSDFKSNITYTEPLSKSLSVVVNYGLSVLNGSNDRRSYNQSVDGTFSDLDSLYSNNFQLDQLANQVGAIFNYKKDKTTLNFGSRFTAVSFNQKNLFQDNEFKRNFLNVNPQVNYRYQFSQQRSIRIGYTGNNTQPTINQIQPVLVNDNPLNIVVGNEGLKPSYRSNISASYNSYKVLTGTSFYIYGSYSFTYNAIATNMTTYAAGNSVLQYENLGGNMPTNFYTSTSYYKKIKKLDANVGGRLNFNGNTSFNKVGDGVNEDQLNKGENYSVSLSASAYKGKSGKYDFDFDFGPSYNVQQSSLQTALNSNGWGLRGNGGFRLYLPAKFEIGTTVNYEYNAPTAVFDDSFSRVLINSNVSKKFLKGDQLRLQLSGNDLLNQNIGFTRNAFNNYINQNSYTTIRRYFMLSVVWDFSKMGAQ